MITALITLLSALGLLIWAIGFFVTLFLLFLNDVPFRYRLAYSFPLFVIALCFGFMLSMPGLVMPLKNITTSYQVPTSILKTNNMTAITHADENGFVIAGFVFPDSSYWDSTNIMVKVVSGKNFYGFDVKPSYEIVPTMKENKGAL